MCSTNSNLVFNSLTPSACNCDQRGSLDGFCNSITGQCSCIPNAYGQACDVCAPGFWNFPNCQQCNCNGHAPLCESRSGVCLQCEDFTVGHYCERFDFNSCKLSIFIGVVMLAKLLSSMSMLTLFASRYTLKGRYNIGNVGKTASMSMLTLFESRYTLKGRYNIIQPTCDTVSARSGD